MLVGAFSAVVSNVSSADCVGKSDAEQPERVVVVV